MSRKLKFGETPFDNLSHDEMVAVVFKLYNALAMAYGVIGGVKKIVAFDIGHDHYWHSKDGGGYIALSKAEEIFNDQTLLKKPTPEEMKIKAFKLYAALTSAHGVMGVLSQLATMRLRDVSYWHEEGRVGYTVLTKTKNLLEEINGDLDAFDIYHCFFKYATPILLDCDTVLGTDGKWWYCKSCHSIIHPNDVEENHHRKPCNGKVRLLTIEDIVTFEKRKNERVL